jgi:hydrogenase nickel incorporation protein HypA/HybF
MHELSIAMSLIEVATEEAERLGNVRVEALHVQLGPLSGVVSDALQFSYELAVAGTPIEGARLEIEEIPVIVFCQNCQIERPLLNIQHFHCPACDEPTPNVLHGRELELAALEVTELATADR